MGTDEKAGPARKPSASERYRVEAKALAVKLLFQGWGLADIRDKIKEALNRPPTLVTLEKWIKEEIDTLKDSRPEVVKNFKFLELEKINRLELEYWQAWEKSIKPQILIREEFEPVEPIPGKRGRKKKSLIHGKLKRTVKESKTMTGEPKHLEGVRWCIDQRIKMLGIEAPAKNDLGAEEKGLQEAAQELQQPGDGTRKIIFKVVKPGNVG